jgi:hypothetical protein
MHISLKNKLHVCLMHTGPLRTRRHNCSADVTAPHFLAVLLFIL